MARSFGRMAINNSIYMHYDTVVVDRDNRTLIFASIVANDKLLKQIGKDIKKKVNCMIEGKASVSTSGKYLFKKEKSANSDFAHAIIKAEDIVDTTGDEEHYEFFLFHRSDEEKYDVLYDKIYKNTSIPVLKQWIPYIYNQLRCIYAVNKKKIYTSHDTAPFTCTKITMTRTDLLGIVKNGLKNRDINIENDYNATETMNEVTGLDTYLNIYGDILADKIQRAFTPKFNPSIDKYTNYVNNYDDSCYYGGIDIYEAQKAVIQSVVNNLKKNKTTFVVGEMGVGSLLCA